jgi:glycosyltransferase involved in cell wall biosynthesis
MRILWLCKKFPHPSSDGETLTIFNRTKAMAKAGQIIDLLYMDTIGHTRSLSLLEASWIKQYNNVHSVKVNNRMTVIKTVKNLFTDNSYHVERFISQEFEVKLKELFEQNVYDLVVFETMYLSSYTDLIRTLAPTTKISCHSHNVEHKVLENIAQNTSLGLKKWYLKLQATRLKRHELAELNKYDFLIPTTNSDKAIFKSYDLKIPCTTISTSLDLSQYLKYPLTTTPDIKPELAFIGALDWTPNLEGILWFIEEVWTVIKTKIPNISLFVAGRNMPDYFDKYQEPGVNMVGEVFSAPNFMSKHDFLIMPVRSSSGIKVKVIESMALGRLVIGSKIGLEGIGVTDRVNVLLAETPEEYITQINFCLENPLKARQIQKNARLFAIENFDSDKNTDKLLSFYKENNMSI